MALCEAVGIDPARRLAQVERERDEAQKILSGIFRWIERRHPDGFIDSLTHEQNLDRVYDRLYDRLDAAIRERDELLAYLDAAHYATCNAELRRERDEAREQLRKCLTK